MISLRPATPADARAIGALCAQLGYPSSEAEIRHRLEALARSPDCEITVADDGGAAVAFVQVSIHRAIESGAWAEIDGLVVEESRRGQGIGAELVAHARAWAAGRGMPRLRVRTNEKRAEAHCFYERLAFTLTKSQRVYDAKP